MNDPDEPTLLTLDEDTLKAPDTRVGSAQGIRSRVAEMKRADNTRAKLRTAWQAVYDGAPPYSQKKLAAKNQKDRTNVNWREAEGMMDNAKTPYYPLVFRQSRFANVCCYYGPNEQQNTMWSDSISEAFHQMLTKWNGHDFNVQLQQWQMCFYGVGVCMFEDSRSPLWRARKIGEVLVPDETEADIDLLEECTVLRKIYPVKLWKMVEKEAAAKEEGWSVTRVKKAIVKNAPLSIRNQFGEDWSESYQASLRRGDVMWNAKSGRIPIADYLAKEFSGKVTHAIILDDGTPADDMNDKSDDGLLFRKVGEAECFSQILQPFFFDIGTGEWHSIKGLGPKIRDFCETFNRTMCSMIDGAKRAAGVLLQANETNAMQQTQLVTIEGGSVIQPGFSVQQHRFSEGLDAADKVTERLQQKVQNSTGTYLTRTSGENSEPTLGQAQLNYRNQSQLSDSAQDRYTKSNDRLYEEQLRRALILGREIYGREKNREAIPPNEANPNLNDGERLALFFYKKCIQLGVPEDVLKFENIESVRATRGIGGGSPAAIDASTRELMMMKPMYDERGQNIVLGLRTSFLVGQSLGKEIVPRFDAQQAPGHDAQQATMENNELRNPDGMVLVSWQDDHLIHFDKHTEDVVQHVQMPNANPMELLAHLHNYGQHSKEHLNKLEGDPTRKEQVQQREAIWLQLSKIQDKLMQNVTEALKSEQANAQPQGPDPELVKGAMKIHGELQLKAAKLKGQQELDKHKLTFKQRIEDAKTAGEIRRKNAMTQADLDAKRAQAEQQAQQPLQKAA